MSSSIDSLKIFVSCSKEFTITQPPFPSLPKLSIKAWSLAGDADLTVELLVNKAFQALGDFDLCLEETTLNDRLIELLVDARNIQTLILRKCMLTEDEFTFFETYPVKEKVVFEGCKLADFLSEERVDAESVKIDTQTEIRPPGSTQWAPEYAPLSAEIQQDLEEISSPLVQKIRKRGTELTSECKALLTKIDFHSEDLLDPESATLCKDIKDLLLGVLSKIDRLTSAAAPKSDWLADELSDLEAKFKEAKKRFQEAEIENKKKWKNLQALPLLRLALVSSPGMSSLPSPTLHYQEFNE